MATKKHFRWLYDNPDGYPPMWYVLSACVLGTILVVVGCVAACVAIAIPINSVACHQAADRVGVKGNYRLLSGCYFTLPNGRVVPQDNYPPKYIHIDDKRGER